MHHSGQSVQHGSALGSAESCETALAGMYRHRGVGNGQPCPALEEEVEVAEVGFQAEASRAAEVEMMEAAPKAEAFHDEVGHEE